jgi:hypothetical protein
MNLPDSSPRRHVAAIHGIKLSHLLCTPHREVSSLFYIATVHRFGVEGGNYVFCGLLSDPTLVYAIVSQWFPPVTVRYLREARRISERNLNV